MTTEIYRSGFSKFIILIFESTNITRYPNLCCHFFVIELTFPYQFLGMSLFAFHLYVSYRICCIYVVCPPCSIRSPKTSFPLLLGVAKEYVCERGPVLDGWYKKQFHYSGLTR